MVSQNVNNLFFPSNSGDCFFSVAQTGMSFNSNWPSNTEEVNIHWNGKCDSQPKSPIFDCKY